MKARCILFTVVLLLCILSGCTGQSAPVETTAAQTVLTTESSATEAPRQDEAKLYTEYLQNGGYDKILTDYAGAGSDYTAEAAFADINDDGVRELLLHITDQSMLGVRGYSSVTVLLGLRDGEVERLGFADYGGGSGGGDYLFFRYDTLENKHVLEYEEFVRDGMFANHFALYTFDMHRRDTQEKQFGLGGEGDVVYRIAHTLRCDSYATEGAYAQDAQKLLAETDLCTQHENVVTAYRFDDNYLDESAYNEVFHRFVEPTDPAYQMKPVTLEDPIPAD